MLVIWLLLLWMHTRLCVVTDEVAKVMTGAFVIVSGYDNGTKTVVAIGIPGASTGAVVANAMAHNHHQIQQYCSAQL